MGQITRGTNELQSPIQKKEQKELLYRQKLLLNEDREAERIKQKSRDAGEETRNRLHQLAFSGDIQSGNTNITGSGTKQKHGVWLALSAFVLVFLIIIIANASKGDNNVDPAPTIPNNQSLISKEAETSQAENDSIFNDGQLFPDSSTRRLTEEEISAINDCEGFTRAELIQFAINELYARNHYSFKQADFKNYYESFSWYSDWGLSDIEACGYFNDIEKYNLDLLTNARNEIQR